MPYFWSHRRHLFYIYIYIYIYILYYICYTYHKMQFMQFMQHFFPWSSHLSQERQFSIKSD